MLRRPEKNVNSQNCFTMADQLDQTQPDQFHMRYWHKCIHHHCKGLFEGEPREALGLGPRWNLLIPREFSDPRGDMLFNPGTLISHISNNYDGVTPQMAARVVRHLGLTGEVDWSVATQEEGVDVCC